MRNTFFAISLAATMALAASALGQGADRDKGGDKTDKKVERAKVGEPAPDFTLTDIEGKKHTLSDYKGKIVVIEWINRECPWSIRACPTMVKLSKAYKDKGVVWLAVDSTYSNQAQDSVEYAREKGIEYPILMDKDGKVGRLYDAKTTPHMFVVAKDGKLAYAGAIDDRSDDNPRNYVAEAVDALMAGKDVGMKETRPYGCAVKYKR
jgi:peroxiredoxin